jgi:hypothetical protein
VGAVARGAGGAGCSSLLFGLAWKRGRRKGKGRGGVESVLAAWPVGETRESDWGCVACDAVTLACWDHLSVSGQLRLDLAFSVASGELGGQSCCARE